MKYIKAWLKIVGATWCFYGISVGVRDTVSAMADNHKSGGSLITKDTSFEPAIIAALKNFKETINLLAEINES